jgi:hypothetical protein
MESKPLSDKIISLKHWKESKETSDFFQLKNEKDHHSKDSQLDSLDEIISGYIIK